jgi:cytidyltransferase-like protein
MAEKNKRKVLVSGCFDMLHSGHIAFHNSAAAFGDLYVCVGSDRTVSELKGRFPVNTEFERSITWKRCGPFMKQSISQGSGLLDFISEMDRIHPDFFVVNSDGHSADKERSAANAG